MLFALIENPNLLPARLQMAMTLGFHIVLACFGVGMPVLMLAAEYRFLKTGSNVWKTIARRWSKSFSVMFAIGAVSGTVLSFELGLLWPVFMETFGGVIGLPFTMEGFAFFLEAIFVGIYLYGWDRLSAQMHWWMGVPVAIAGLLSAGFVVTANAWMNCPQGFGYVNEKAEQIDPIRAMLNPASGPQVLHMVLAAYMVTGFCVASYYAFCRLRGDSSDYVRKAMGLGLSLALVATPFQMLVGDWSAKMVAELQPIKLAAMEGHYETTTGASLLIGGIPNDNLSRTDYAIRIPRGLSFLAHGDLNSEVLGLNEWALSDRPPTLVVHIAFQIMVGAGSLLMLLAVWAFVSLIRTRAFPVHRWFTVAVVIAGPLSVAALEAGWTVTEVGRQPWIVQGFMRTHEAVTDAPGVWPILWSTLGVYVLLGGCTIAVLRLQARVPIQEATSDP